MHRPFLEASGTTEVSYVFCLTDIRSTGNSQEPSDSSPWCRSFLKLLQREGWSISRGWWGQPCWVAALLEQWPGVIALHLPVEIISTCTWLSLLAAWLGRAAQHPEILEVLYQLPTSHLAYTARPFWSPLSSQDISFIKLEVTFPGNVVS